LGNQVKKILVLFVNKKNQKHFSTGVDCGRCACDPLDRAARRIAGAAAQSPQDFRNGPIFV